ncbi:hypothetical protein K0J45_12575 [Shewanella alkalitolerans]|uniref:hypothetical protein n=1 Tax=Shewanella alkalitolerans TaxID=2864209 RepID=UPI001C657CCF|nr:hypothetical protein [Shewanella alkalitolerans]QYJ96381.1 hypothetical protein K0J45_12575 [Shewanella alkalitolerans]
MNVHGINAFGAQSLGPQSLSSVDVRDPNAPEALQNPSHPNQSEQTQSSSDRVSLSEAGKKALAYSTGNALHDNGAAKTDKARKAEEAEEDENLSEIDKKIKELKQKLEELQLELQALQGDDSETAELKRKMLQDQIAITSTQLMTLLKAKEKPVQTRA